MTYRALLVDDEHLARKELRSLLNAYDAIDVVGEADGVAAAALQVDALHPDVVFLDIQMPGETGFDLFDAVDHPMKVIFVTAYDQHAIRAFDVNALDYLLKPVHPDRLARAIERLAGDNASEPPRTEALEHSDRLCLHDQGRMYFFLVRDIVYIAAAGDYTEVYLQNGRMHLALRPLHAWEDCLPDQHFVRIHRSTLVNLEHVSSVKRSRGYTYHVHLSNTEKPITMSRRYAAKVKERFRM
ncbi:MAG: response regulator [Bacteroidetes bacterium]|jgi:two-component system LytT family response regulator|nr:response regulator [Bacteroidota bacterium]